MKYLTTIFLFVLLIGCSPTDEPVVEQGAAVPVKPLAQVEFMPQSQQEKWKADTALYLYQTLEKYNFDYAAKHYVTDPEAVLQLKEGWNLKTEGYRVKAINDQGVVMGFTRFCYPEMDVQIYMVQKGQRYFVEFGRTLREQIRNHSNHTPLRQYCYDFKNQPLQGIVMSSTWAADRAETHMMKFNTGNKLRVDVVSERCAKYPDCSYFQEDDGNGSGFILGVSSLDFAGTGGNLGGSQYITVSNPDYSTINRHDGSYRVTRLENGKTRLELAIPEFESTGFNGYIDIDLPEAKALAAE